jgi:quinate dehydrogenase (quinone)
MAAMLVHAFAAVGCQAPQTGEWRHYASDLASSKYSPLSQITRENAQALTVAWVWSSPDNELVDDLNANGVAIWPHAYETSPLMVRGVLYASTSLSQVAAIDASTGRTLWVYDPKSYLGADGAAIAFPPNIGFVGGPLPVSSIRSPHRRPFVETP